MICPKCKAEYVEGYTECADCRVPLVSPEALEAQQQEQKTLKPVNYKLVRLKAERGDLWFLQSVLEGEGIDYFWHSDHTSMFQFPGQGGLLMVDETKLDEVRQILFDLEIDNDLSDVDDNAIASLFKRSHAEWSAADRDEDLENDQS